MPKDPAQNAATSSTSSNGNIQEGSLSSSSSADSMADERGRPVVVGFPGGNGLSCVFQRCEGGEAVRDHLLARPHPETSVLMCCVPKPLRLPKGLR